MTYFFFWKFYIAGTVQDKKVFFYSTDIIKLFIFQFVGKMQFFILIGQNNIRKTQF